MKKLISILIVFALTFTGAALAENIPGTFSLCVRENATTGYTWSYKLSGDDCLKLKDDVLTLDNTDPGMVGVGGTRIYTFEAVCPGTAVITLNWGRSWKEGYEKQYTYTVNVGEDLIPVLTKTTAPTASLTLYENASAGYCWQAQIEDEKQLFLLQDTSESIGEGDAFGAGSERTFVFQAMGKEGCTVTFTYARLREKDSMAATVTADFTVDENGMLLLTNLTVLSPDGYADSYVINK